MVKNTMPYAQALYEIAAETHEEAEYLSQLEQIRDLLVSQPEYMQALAHPKIEKKLKKEWMAQLFESQVNGMVANFMQVLAEQNMAAQIENVYRDFLDLYRQDQNIEVVKVQSAGELDEDQQQRLIAMLEKKLNKKIELSIDINPELIAGLRVQARDFLLDNSIKSRLDSMKEKLSS